MAWGGHVLQVEKGIFHFGVHLENIRGMKGGKSIQIKLKLPDLKKKIPQTLWL